MFCAFATKAAAEAELLDTLVNLVALKAGAGGGATQGGVGDGAEGGWLGNGRYAIKLSGGKESTGKAEESTLVNLLFVPDGRWVSRPLGVALPFL